MIAVLEKRGSVATDIAPSHNRRRAAEHNPTPEPDGASRFVSDWDWFACHFLSAFYHDTFAGHFMAVDMGLGRHHFPRLELWQTAEILGLCGLADIQRPGLGLILGYADDIGVALCGDNDRDLDWLRDLEGSAAGLEACGYELEYYNRRARTAGKLFRAYQRVLNHG